MRSRRERQKGRRESGRFALLPESVITHPALTSLDLGARWVLVALAAGYNGHNNGALVITRASAKRFGINSSGTLRRGLGQLEERGLILKTDPGAYIPRSPARYALTFQRIDKTEFTPTPRAAPHDYKQWDTAA